MSERRQLIEGIRPPAVSSAEKQFVFGGKAPPDPADSPLPTARAPLTTRVRADLAAALKRASLERQLANQPMSEIQEILDAALEPWLKQHGYL